MSKNQDTTKYNITIHPKVISNLKTIQKKIMELTDNDEDLVTNIVEYSLEMNHGKRYINDVYDLVWKKYPGIHTDSELRAAGKSELFDLIFNLNQIRVGQDEITKEVWKNFPKKQCYHYLDQFRERIEPEILKIFYPGEYENEEMQVTDVIGEVTDQLNSIDI
jgi:hypothetical protein